MSNTEKIVSESYPEWKSLKNEAGRAVTFSYFAYEQEDEGMQSMANEIPPGYELFLMTDHLDDAKKSSFRCVAFMNQENKEVIFASAGSRFGPNKVGLSDAYDDLMLSLKKKPHKFKSAQVLNEMVLDSLGEEAANYKFQYVGHSLGAAIAEIQAADMDIKLTKKGLKQDKQQISSIAFESPGTKSIIEKMYKKEGLPKETREEVNFINFNNRSNFINSLHEQAGKVYTIVPHDQEERNPSKIEMFFEVIAKFVGENCSKMLGKIFSLLAPGGISMELVNEHALDRFDDVFVQKYNGSVVKDDKENILPLEEAYSGIKPIEFNTQAAREISKIKEQNGSIGKQKFTMNNFDKNTGEISKVVFSELELKKAYQSISRNSIKSQYNTTKFSDLVRDNNTKAKDDLSLLNMKEVLNASKNLNRN